MEQIEPFLSLLKFLLPQSSEQADSCKHKAPAPVWGEGGAPGSRNVNIKVKSCLRMQKLHDIETSIYGKGEHKLGTVQIFVHFCR